MKQEEVQDFIRGAGVIIPTVVITMFLSVAAVGLGLRIFDKPSQPVATESFWACGASLTTGGKDYTVLLPNDAGKDNCTAAPYLMQIPVVKNVNFKQPK